MSIGFRRDDESPGSTNAVEIETLPKVMQQRSLMNDFIAGAAENHLIIREGQQGLNHATFQRKPNLGRRISIHDPGMCKGSAQFEINF